MSFRYGLPIFAALLPIAASAEQPDWQAVRPVVEKTCVECHGGKKTKGNVDLKALLADPKVAGNFELWEKWRKPSTMATCRRRMRRSPPPMKKTSW